MTARAQRLPEMPAVPFLRLLPDAIVRSMDGADFVLNSRMRPVVAADGGLVLRLVWRRRETGSSMVLIWRVVGGIDDELMDALDAAMASIQAPRAAG